MRARPSASTSSSIRHWWSAQSWAAASTAGDRPVDTAERFPLTAHDDRPPGRAAPARHQAQVGIEAVEGPRSPVVEHHAELGRHGTDDTSDQLALDGGQRLAEVDRRPGVVPVQRAGHDGPERVATGVVVGQSVVDDCRGRLPRRRSRRVPGRWLTR